MTASSVVHFMPLAENFYGVAVLSADSLSGTVVISWADNSPINIGLP